MRSRAVCATKTRRLLGSKAPWSNKVPVESGMSMTPTALSGIAILGRLTLPARRRELTHLGADRIERTIFVLLRREIVRVGAIGRIDRLLQLVRKILVEVGSRRSLEAVHVGRGVVGVSIGEDGLVERDAVRHVVTHEGSGGEDASHAGAVVVAVWSHERR